MLNRKKCQSTVATQDRHVASKGFTAPPRQWQCNEQRGRAMWAAKGQAAWGRNTMHDYEGHCLVLEAWSFSAIKFLILQMYTFTTALQRPTQKQHPCDCFTSAHTAEAHTTTASLRLFHISPPDSRTYNTVLHAPKPHTN
eukprot:363655-Chlamydomonas_euryale.AAC.11